MKILIDNSLNLTETKKTTCFENHQKRVISYEDYVNSPDYPYQLSPMMHPYGINERKFKFTYLKYKKQNDFLQDNFITTSSGAIKCLMDITISANHSKRYYPEIQNRLNAFNDIVFADNRGKKLKATLLTITLDGYFRDFLRADFSRYNEAKHGELIPNDDVYGFLKDKISNGEAFTIDDCIKCLSFQWFRFSKSGFRQKLKKNDSIFSYIKGVEPHSKDGVPHAHALCYVEEKYINDFKNAFIRYFPAPRNTKKKNDSDLMGFETNVRNPVGYIVKYIMKSFINLEKDENLQPLHAWYILHKVRRFTMSRDTIPLWVFRKLFVFFTELNKDRKLDEKVTLLTVHRHLKLNALSCEWSLDDDYIDIVFKNGTRLIYDDGITYYFLPNGELYKQIGKIRKSELRKINNSEKSINKKIA